MYNGIVGNKQYYYYKRIDVKHFINFSKMYLIILLVIIIIGSLYY
jgi:hypothetical protein